MERKPSFSPSSSSFSSPPAKTFDVFLSFRGEDTRKNFTGHLSLALRKIGLFNIFKDDYALDKGKDIETELMKAIEDSQYAVVVLSENYATSSWCLKELTKIVECMGDSGRIRTIFYHVDPSHVRYHKESFGKALEEHEKDPRHRSEEVKSWRKALTKVANLSGEPVQSYPGEAIFIEEFVAKISSDLGASITTTEGLFGMTSRLMKLDSYVLQSSTTNTVCFIGIHGMGGIGKSTLARAYYNKMRHGFDGSSFLQDVRKVKASGLVYLQKQLLEDILKDKFERVRHVDDGKNMIKSRLRTKKVLIVLDNVSKDWQLDALADENKWFGSGSVIIVTSREDSFLKIRKYAIYKAECLDSIEALQLFSWKAFRSIEPPDQEYKELSEQVVKYASYLPLALRVLGSLLGSKEKSLWNSALRRLSEAPEKEIVEILKISFDDLEQTDKRIFLDIACFYDRVKAYDELIEILDSCWVDLKYGISNLTDKSLLSINEDEEYGTTNIWMHDLLVEMGKDIVRKESGNEVAKQSRIWNADDFRQILETKKGTNEIEAIVIWEDYNITEYGFEAFSHMDKLRLLVIAMDDYDGGLDDCDGLVLSNNLLYLEWRGFPYKKLPSNFQPRNLVELILRESNIKQLWNNCMKTLDNLKVINLSLSPSFTKFDDFTVVPNLEYLTLRYCRKLSEIHPSIKHLKKLILLDLKGCTSLEKLPEEISCLPLETLDLRNCSALDKVPDNLEQLTSLRELALHCSGIKHLPSFIFVLENLESVINFEDEEGLGSVIREKIINYHTTGKCVFPSWFFTFLTRLDLIDCNLTGPEAFLECFKKLVFLSYLNLSKNPLSVLPPWINELSSLTTLRLEHCKSLGCLEAELLPSSLEEVYVNYCTSLASFLDPLKPCHLRCSAHCLDCTELVKRQDGNMTALASLSRFLEEYLNRKFGSFEFVVPQSDNELPSWFINQSSTASISIKLDPNRCNSELIGFAMVFCFRDNSSTHDDFSCKIRVRGSEDWEITREVGAIESSTSDRIFLLYCALIAAPWCEPPSCETLEFSVFSTEDDEDGSSCGPCGVRLVYEEDIEELKRITSQYYNAQKDVQSSDSQSQVSKLRQMGPIGRPLTGLRGILDSEDNLLLDPPNNPESNSSVVGNTHFGVFRNYSGITAKFLDNMQYERDPK